MLDSLRALEPEGGSSTAGWALSGKDQPDFWRLAFGRCHLSRFILLCSLKICFDLLEQWQIPVPHRRAIAQHGQAVRPASPARAGSSNRNHHRHHGSQLSLGMF